MTSFQLSVSPQRKVAARFVEAVRRRLQRAYAEAPKINQSDMARELGVHRSIITRQLRGYQDISLARVGELAWALGYEPLFDLVPICADDKDNARHELPKLLQSQPSVFKTRVETTEAKKTISQHKLEMAP